MRSIARFHELLTTPSASRPGDAGDHLATRVQEILCEIPAVHVDSSNEEVRVFLASHVDMESVAVVDDVGRPIGLINRSIFADAFARPFAREIYGRRSCLAWMDKAPLALEETTDIETLVKAAVAKGSKVLKDGFIGTRDGRYVGLGTGFSLLKAMEALEAEKTRQLLESIDYASAIQRSHLRNSALHLASALTDYSLHWAPRDVVGGDCYFFGRTSEGLFGAIVDCTGHGVPGAFMSLITLSFLGFQLAAPEGRHDPGEVLTRLHRHIKSGLAQDSADLTEGDGEAAGRASDDGMDAAAFLLSPNGERLLFASARTPLILADADARESVVLDAERMGIGYRQTPDDYQWKTREVMLPKSCRVMICTDGIIDQVGGPKSISLGRRRLAEWLNGACGQPAAAIGQEFLAYFKDWQGDEVRRDDATFLVFNPRGT